jgi:Uma2 family endonuclease
VATTSTRLMTFEEFEKLPDHPHGLRHELRHGELFLLPPPIHKHYRVLHRLIQLLGRTAGSAGEVGTEFGFRPRGDRDYRIADVVFLAKDRWDSIDKYLTGSPDLVIEVLSPSNTETEIRDKQKLCLATGSHEFWIVDVDLREVEVSTPGGHSVIYKSGQEIPLFFGGRIAVDEIFS